MGWDGSGRIADRLQVASARWRSADLGLDSAAEFVGVADVVKGFERAAGAAYDD